MNEYEFLLLHQVRQRELEQQAEHVRQLRSPQPKRTIRWAALFTGLRRWRQQRREKLIFEADCG